MQSRILTLDVPWPGYSIVRGGIPLFAARFMEMFVTHVLNVIFDGAGQSDIVQHILHMLDLNQRLLYSMRVKEPRYHSFTDVTLLPLVGERTHISGHWETVYRGYRNYEYFLRHKPFFGPGF